MADLHRDAKVAENWHDSTRTFMCNVLKNDGFAHLVRTMINCGRGLSSGRALGIVNTSDRGNRAATDQFSIFSQIPTIARHDGSGSMDGATAAGVDQRLLHAQGRAFATPFRRATPGARPEVSPHPALHRIRATPERR